MNGSDSGEWITRAAAAELIGCSLSTVGSLVDRGELHSRRPGRGKQTPSISLASAVKAREARETRLAAQAARERAQKESRESLDENFTWIDSHTAAAVLGVTLRRINQAAFAGRLPYVQIGRKRWIRLDIVERLAARRALIRHHGARSIEAREGLWWTPPATGPGNS